MPQSISTSVIESVQKLGPRRDTTIAQLDLTLVLRLILEVIDDLSDSGGISDTGNNLYSASASATGLNVDIENPLYALRPGHRRASFCG